MPLVMPQPRALTSASFVPARPLLYLCSRPPSSLCYHHIALVKLVTETDQGVEKFVAEKIRSAYPLHEFIGEESYAAGEKHALGDAPTWIVDPVDVSRASLSAETSYT